MAKIYQSVTELIGGTPLLHIGRMEKAWDTKARVLVKLEYLNPAGSTKDRAALSMIRQAEADGLLRPGDTIIEPTSGNTGIGLAVTAAVNGYHLILTMPETMSIERRNILKAYGAQLVLTEGAKGMNGAIEKAEELHRQVEGSFLAGQFVNPANPKAHYETTGPEIWKDTEGQVDVLVVGVGTGGTLTGTGTYLKEKNPALRVIAVEPAASPVLSGGTAGSHPLQGIGAGFIPENLDTNLYDEVVTVTGDEAFRAAKELAKTEGVLAGISSGAALAAGLKEAKRTENEGKTVVVILPDSGDRYYSTPLFQD